jgi:cytochrome c-type biogenesis protein
MDLLAPVSDALGAAPAWAAVAALAWGLMSIWLSPCHLAGIALVVGYLAGGAGYSWVRLRIVLAFALGALAGIVPLAGLSLGLGRLAGDLGGGAVYLVAAGCIVAGLYLLDVVALPGGWGLPTPERRGQGTAFLLGGAFGFALGPCAFAWIAPVLGAAWLTAADDFGLGLLLVALFAAGHCLAVLLAALSLDAVQRWLDALGRRRGARYGRAASGGLLLVAGGWLLATALFAPG